MDASLYPSQDNRSLIARIIGRFRKPPDPRNLDPTGSTLIWWRDRNNELLNLALYFFRLSALVAGVSATAALFTDLSPLQIEAAEIVFSQACDAILLSAYAVSITWLYKVVDIGNVFSPRRSLLSKRAQLRHFGTGLLMFVLFCLPIGWVIGPNVINLKYAKPFIKEASRILKCEANHWRSIQQPKYVPDASCIEIHLELDSGARISRPTLDRPPNDGY